MTQNGPKWSKMAQNNPKWPKMAKNEPKWATVTQIWPQMAQNGSRMTQNDPKWPKHYPKWPKITQNGPKITPGFTHFSTEKAVPQTFSLLEHMVTRRLLSWLFSCRSVLEMPKTSSPPPISRSSRRYLIFYLYPLEAINSNFKCI